MGKLHKHECLWFVWNGKLLTLSEWTRVNTLITKHWLIIEHLNSTGISLWTNIATTIIFQSRPYGQQLSLFKANLMVKIRVFKHCVCIFKNFQSRILCEEHLFLRNGFLSKCKVWWWKNLRFSKPIFSPNNRCRNPSFVT